MVHPLIHDNQRAFEFSEMGDGVFREYCHAIRVDGIGDAVVDLGIDMVRTSAENDAMSTGILEILEGLFSLLLDITTEGPLGFPSEMSSFSNFSFRDIEFLPEDFYELICEDLLEENATKGFRKRTFPEVISSTLFLMFSA